MVLQGFQPFTAIQSNKIAVVPKLTAVQGSQQKVMIVSFVCQMQPFTAVNTCYIIATNRVPSELT